MPQGGGEGHILCRPFLFPIPVCLSLVGLKDEPLSMGWDLVEPERSLVLGTGPPAADCCVETPAWPVDMLLCKQIDNTISTSGDGPNSNTLIIITSDSSYDNN